MWSTGYSARCPREPASTALRGLLVEAPGAGSGNDGSWAGGGLGTLLGPEETGPSAPGHTVSPTLHRVGWAGCVGVGLFLRLAGPGRRIPVGVWLGWWSRLFFENCTVDASISDSRMRSFPFFGRGCVLVSAIC
jgi:hypothetical protein